MKQNKQRQHNLRARAFGDALREGVRRDVLMRACLDSNAPLSKLEDKLQAEMEDMLEEYCQYEAASREEQAKLEAEATRRAFKRGLELGVRTE